MMSLFCIYMVCTFMQMPGGHTLPTEGRVQVYTCIIIYVCLLCNFYNRPDSIESIIQWKFYSNCGITCLAKSWYVLVALHSLRCARLCKALFICVFIFYNTEKPVPREVESQVPSKFRSLRA